MALNDDFMYIAGRQPPDLHVLGAKRSKWGISPFWGRGNIIIVSLIIGKHNHQYVNIVTST